MTRYPAAHKDETRARILAAAARRFRADGLDGAGIAAVMHDAGLTNGAFYAHFASKDELVGEVVADQILRQAAEFEAAAAHPDGLDRVIDGYLSPEHRDDLMGGCFSAALLGELGRASGGVRGQYSAALCRLITAFRHLAGIPDCAPDAVVRSRLAYLVGTMQMARAMNDCDLATELLAETKRSIRALVAEDRALA